MAEASGPAVPEAEAAGMESSEAETAGSETPGAEAAGSETSEAGTAGSETPDAEAAGSEASDAGAAPSSGTSGDGAPLIAAEPLPAEEPAPTPTEEPLPTPTPEPYADVPTAFEDPGFPEELLTKNAAIWAIQNDLRREDGTPETVDRAMIRRLTEAIAARPQQTPEQATAVYFALLAEIEGTAQETAEGTAPAAESEETQPAADDGGAKPGEAGDPGGAEAAGQPVTLRELYDAAFRVYAKRYLKTEIDDSLMVRDETLSAWAAAYHLDPAGGDLESPADAGIASRAFYLAEAGTDEMTEGLMRMPLIYQGIGFWDGDEWRHIEWATAEFAINHHTMSEAGCGFCAASMAMSYLKGYVIPPTEFMENGQYTGSGAAHTVGVVSAEGYGIPAHRTGDIEEVRQALRDGLPVMALEKGNTQWAVTGHFILLGGIARDGRIAVYNPGGTVHCQYDAVDYGLYQENEITDTVNGEIPYTIFGR